MYTVIINDVIKNSVSTELKKFHYYYIDRFRRHHVDLNPSQSNL